MTQRQPALDPVRGAGGSSSQTSETSPTSLYKHRGLAEVWFAGVAQDHGYRPGSSHLRLPLLRWRWRFFLFCFVLTHLNRLQNHTPTNT